MREAFPIDISAEHIDHMVKCIDFQELKMEAYSYENKGVPNALLFFMPALGDYCKNYGYFFRKFAD